MQWSSEGDLNPVWHSLCIHGLPVLVQGLLLCSVTNAGAQKQICVIWMVPQSVHVFKGCDIAHRRLNPNIGAPSSQFLPGSLCKKILRNSCPFADSVRDREGRETTVQFSSGDRGGVGWAVCKDRTAEEQLSTSQCSRAEFWRLGSQATVRLYGFV